jgi:F-type H+-transporting ATPase subunit b
VLIDWFTVIAQIINFLILVVLLKIFLYDRVVQAIDQRKEQAESAFGEAEQKQQQAKQTRQEFEQKQADLEEQKDAILSDARQEGRDKRDELVEEARQDVQEKRQQWARSLEQHQREFMDRLREELARQLSAAARKILRDLADVDLERQVVATFLTRVESMSDEDRSELTKTVGDGDSVTVMTAWELSQDQREEIESRLREPLGLDDGQGPEFATADDLICGIEVRGGGQRVGWHLSAYLSELTSSVEDAISSEVEGSGPQEPSDGSDGGAEADEQAGENDSEEDSEEEA